VRPMWVTIPSASRGLGGRIRLVPFTAPTLPGCPPGPAGQRAVVM
jgi:hypothetical protein